MFKTGIVDVPYPELSRDGYPYFSQAQAKAVINKIMDVLTNEQDDRATGLILNFAYYDESKEYAYLHANSTTMSYTDNGEGTDGVGTYYSITFDGLTDVFDSYNDAITCNQCTLKLYFALPEGTSTVFPNVIEYK